MDSCNLQRDRKFSISALTQSTAESADRGGKCESAFNSKKLFNKSCLRLESNPGTSGTGSDSAANFSQPPSVLSSFDVRQKLAKEGHHKRQIFYWTINYDDDDDERAHKLISMNLLSRRGGTDESKLKLLKIKLIKVKVELLLSVVIIKHWAVQAYFCLYKIMLR